MGIGLKLKYLIELNGTNVNELAAATGVNPQTIYSIIKRDSEKASINDLGKIAYSLGVDLNYFYSDRGIIKPATFESDGLKENESLFIQLSPSDQESALDYMRFLKKKKDKEEMN